MSRPGVEVSSAASAPPLGVPTDTSVAFVVGEAQMGPVDAPTRLTSLDDFVNTYGDRITGVESYDALDTYFHEGGATAYFLRLADGAVAATGDAASIVAGNTLQAASPGAWGDGLKLDVVSTPGGMTFAADESRQASRRSKQEATARRAATVGAADLSRRRRPGRRRSWPRSSLGGKAVQTSQPMVTRRELSQFLDVGQLHDDPRPRHRRPHRRRVGRRWPAAMTAPCRSR